MSKETQMHSAEWLRGVVAVLGRMVDECQTVFDSDLPHITEGNLEDYLAEYSHQLAEAGAREAGEPMVDDKTALALAKAHWITASPHEWPTVDDIPLLCHALIKEHGRVTSAADVMSACKRILLDDLRNVEDEQSSKILHGVIERVSAWEAAHPSLADQLAAAQAEVAKLAELVKEYLDPEEWKHENRSGWILCSGCGAQLDLGRYHAPDCKWVTRVKQAESPALAWLAARDARMKAMGAAEWLEGAAREGGYYERSSEGMREEAAQLRQQAEAARLAEGE